MKKFCLYSLSCLLLFLGLGAVVTDIEWVDHMITLFGWMTPGEVRHFPLAQRDEAIAWAAAR